jgi:hypothetical protein
VRGLHHIHTAKVAHCDIRLDNFHVFLGLVMNLGGFGAAGRTLDGCLTCTELMYDLLYPALIFFDAFSNCVHRR